MGISLKTPHELAVQRVNTEPGLLNSYQIHFHRREKRTSECFSCLVYTNSNYFNHNYKTTERGTTYPMARPYSPDDFFEAYTPTVTTPAPAGAEFRPATSVCPYEDSRVTFIVFTENSRGVSLAGATGRFCKTVAEKRTALLNFRPGRDTLLVAWPGEYSQDIFRITTVEERTKALARFGIVPQPTATPPKTYTAADGTVYVDNSK